MEEADARLQEVVASLLNEHGGNHEQALRQTFACLHNSGLYEAQSAAEEEQREQQVCARGCAGESLFGTRKVQYLPQCRLSKTQSVVESL